MGQARQIMDRITEAVMSGDAAALAQLYAADAVAETPDAGRLEGREAIAGYLAEFGRAFSDVRFEMVSTLESGDTAVDEGYFMGTNTGPLTLPDGEVPATGKSVRVRECDLLSVRDGAAVFHRFYFDSLEFLTQLGLAPGEAVDMPGQRADAEQDVRAHSS